MCLLAGWKGKVMHSEREKEGAESLLESEAAEAEEKVTFLWGLPSPLLCDAAR